MYERSYEFSEESFWGKVKLVVLRAGRSIIRKALILYYAAQEPDTPAWAKSTIYSALVYLISPVDAIPDITPGIGYSDDMSVLAAALLTVAAYITDDVRKKAEDKLNSLF